METQRTESVTRIITGISLIAAPLLFTLGNAIHPAESKDGATQLRIVAENGARWNLAHAFILVAVALFIPATFGILGLLHGKGFGIGIAGGATMAVGLVFFGALVGVDALASSAFATLPANQQAALAPGMQALIDAKGAAALVYIGIVGFSLGLLLLAAALFVSRAAPRWTSGAIALAVAVMLAGLDNVKIIAVGAAILLIGFGALGLTIVRVARAATMRPSRIPGDVTPAHP